MKAGIAGAGAVGCHYGSKLQQGGVDVVYLARGKHLKALQTTGLTHHSLLETTQLKVKAAADASLLADCDVILLACKTTGLEAICTQLAEVVSPACVLLTMQNGVEAPEIVQRCFPDNPVIAASAFIGVRIDAPGVINHTAAGHIRLGVYANQQRDSARRTLETLMQAWAAAGVDVAEPEDVHTMLWHKMLWNCGFNAITALTHRFARDIAVDADTVRWVKDAMQETLQLAHAMGVVLSAEAIDQHIALTAKGGEVKTSMWQDMEQGRPTEIAAMSGYVSSKARELGIAAPVNDLLASLIRAADRGHFK